MFVTGAWGAAAEGAGKAILCIFVLFKSNFDEVSPCWLLQASLLCKAVPAGCSWRGRVEEESPACVQ